MQQRTKQPGKQPNQWSSTTNAMAAELLLSFCCVGGYHMIRDGSLCSARPKARATTKGTKINNPQQSAVSSSHLIPLGALLQPLRPLRHTALHKCRLRLRHHRSPASVTHDGCFFHARYCLLCCYCCGAGCRAVSVGCASSKTGTYHLRLTLIHSFCGAPIHNRIIKERYLR